MVDNELIKEESSIIGNGINGLKPLKDIERSIIKTYRKHIWTKFIKGLQEFEMLNEGDKVAVAISGGKDSLLLAKLFQELQAHSKYDFEVVFIAMDPGYAPEKRRQLEEITKYLNIPTHIYDSDVFAVAEKVSEENPCYMCGRMRRGSLYSKAQELGCNKLALGHHRDDVIETVLLNVLCSGNYKTMMPKLKSKNFEGMELIRPMYFVEEEYIHRFFRSTGLEPLDCACTVTSKTEDMGKRAEIKELIKTLTKTFDNVESSIMRSAYNVEIGSIIGWKDIEGNENSFLDFYENRRN
ncbi:MAG: tRNA 2-thiocytidine biosynthesis protein TtcA [Tissierellia bacterium]|nr:tRNA 2-thiocytidine biosynthesis protein TtcA [Tissierellia bacterium]